jgi:hypothetical protein
MFRRLLAGLLLAAAGASPVRACDLCSLYTSFAARDFRPGWSVGLFEQYTDFGTVQEEGHEIDDPAQQRLRSSISQLFVGYQWNRRFGLQVNVPWIDRSYRRLEEGEPVEGDERGVGDVVLSAHWQAIELVRGTDTLSFALLVGAKLPTGDSNRLAEELEEGHHHEMASARTGGLVPRLAAHDGEHEEMESAIHGHDLALGSGSLDFVLGARVAGTISRGFFEVAAQYALRREGDFDYRFANDLQAAVAGGGYLLLEHDRTFALGAQLAGEWKGRDELAGEPLDDTSISSLFAGPLARYSHGESWYLELALDLPLSIDNGAVQIVPDWRARLGATHRF